jgi:hypothetical protein
VADLVVQETDKSGISPSFSAADSAGDTFTNTGNTVFYVKNASASQITITIDSLIPCNQGYYHDLSVNVAAGGEQMIGPFDQKRFNDEQEKVSAAYSAVSSITVAAIKLGE